MTAALSRQGLAVGLCTYRRPAGLLRLLDGIAISAKSLPVAPQIIVVDNDGTDLSVGGAVSAFAGRSGLAVHYSVTTQPGISAARNAVFAEAERLGVRFVAMIDDDEWPTEPWLRELVDRQASERAVVVGGPVRPVFPDDRVDTLAHHARFWSVEKQFMGGRPYVFCTCNFLIDMDAIASIPRPLFDEEFGLSGGGDTVFFRKLFFAGLPMAWSDAAIVHEEVPAARASIAWLRQRRFRIGNHAVRWENVSAGGRWRSFLKTLGLTARLPIYPLLGRSPESQLLGWLIEFDKVRGRYNAHVGDTFMEYGRPKADGSAGG